MKQIFGLKKKLRHLAWLLVFLVLTPNVWCRWMVQYEYDFNFQVYEILTPTSPKHPPGTNPWFIPPLLKHLHFHLLKQDRLRCTPISNKEYQFLIPGPPQLCFRVKQYNHRFSKGSAPYHFNFLVREIVTEDTGGITLLEEELHYPGSGFNFWCTKIPGNKHLLVILKTVRHEFWDKLLPYKVIRKIIPPYPPWALSKGIPATVTMEVVTDIYGRVKQILSPSGPALFRKGAVAAAKQWVVEPYILSGVPKPIHFTLVFHFRPGKN